MCRVLPYVSFSSSSVSVSTDLLIIEVSSRCFLAFYNHCLPQTTNSLLTTYLSAWSCLCPWPLPALSVFTILPFFKELGSDSSYWHFLLRNLTPQPDRCPLEPDRFAWSSTTTKKEAYFDCQGHWELCTTSNILKYIWWSTRCPHESLPSFETIHKIASM